MMIRLGRLSGLSPDSAALADRTKSEWSTQFFSPVQYSSLGHLVGMVGIQFSPSGTIVVGCGPQLSQTVRFYRLEWMVRRGGNSATAKWLVKLRSSLGTELQELFHPRWPSVKTVAQTGSCHIPSSHNSPLNPASLAYDERTHGKPLGCPMEEGGNILFRQVPRRCC